MRPGLRDRLEERERRRSARGPRSAVSAGAALRVIDDDLVGPPAERGIDGERLVLHLAAHERQVAALDRVVLAASRRGPRGLVGRARPPSGPRSPRRAGARCRAQRTAGGRERHAHARAAGSRACRCAGSAVGCVTQARPASRSRAGARRGSARAPAGPRARARRPSGTSITSASPPARRNDFARGSPSTVTRPADDRALDVGARAARSARRARRRGARPSRREASRRHRRPRLDLVRSRIAAHARQRAGSRRPRSRSRRG